MTMSLPFRITFGAALTLFMFVATISGQEVNSGAGTSAFSFLKINVGSRAVGMGGAFTGLADDQNSLYYNPAGIAGLEDRAFIAEYHDYFAGLQSGFAGLVRPMGSDKALGFHITYLDYGEFIQTDQAGNEEGTFSGSDMVFAFTLAMRKTHQLFFGATAKFIYESIQDYSATGLALDLGVRYMSDRGRYAGGLAIQNLGAQLSSLGTGEKDGLPTTLRVGGSAKPPGLFSVLALDVIVPFDNDIDFAVGVEYFKVRPLLLRLGWNSFGSNFRSDYSDNGLAGLNFGLGLEYNKLQISYAFTPAADLGDSHRVTIAGGF